MEDNRKLCKKIIEQIFAFIYVSINNKKIEKKISLNNGLLTEDDLNLLKVKYKDGLDRKGSLDDKLKINVVGLSLAITVIIGSIGNIESVLNVCSSKSALGTLSALLIISVVYLFFSGVSALEGIANKNMANYIQKDAKEDYIYCIEENNKMNMQRNNYLYASYIDLRNALALLMLALVVFLYLEVKAFSGS